MSAEIRNRKQYLVMKGLQFKYMALVLISMVIVTAFIVWTVYYTHWTMITANIQSLQAQATLALIFKRINFILLIEIPAMLIAAAVFSVFISHKIAGPVYRLARTAREVADGNLTLLVRLRQGDELKDLAAAFNTMVENMQRLVSEDKKIIGELSQVTTKLYGDIKEKRISTDEAIPLIKKLNDLVSELKNLVALYRVDSKG